MKQFRFSAHAAPVPLFSISGFQNKISAAAEYDGRFMLSGLSGGAESSSRCQKHAGTCRVQNLSVAAEMTCRDWQVEPMANFCCSLAALPSAEPCWAIDGGKPFAGVTFSIPCAVEHWAELLPRSSGNIYLMVGTEEAVAPCHREKIRLYPQPSGTCKTVICERGFCFRL